MKIAPLLPSVRIKKQLLLAAAFSLLALAGCEVPPDQPIMVVEHKAYGNPAVIHAVEYFLPATEMPAEVRDKLHPWIKQMVGKAPAEVRAMVAQRWSPIQNPELREMRDRLLEFQPTSIIVHGGAGWLRLRVESADGASIGDSWYLPAPGDDAEWERRMKSAGIGSNPVFLEFVRHFGGLREDLPGHSGDFLYLDAWDTFPLPGYQLSEIKQAKEWQGSLLVYHGRGGDSLLLHPSGRVGWWLFAEHEVIEGHDDFAAFTKYFTKYSREYSFPLEGFLPDDQYRR